MRNWSLVGVALVLCAAVPLLRMRLTEAESTAAASWMIGFSSELDAYAARHDGCFPPTYGDMLVERSAPHAGHPIDPWDRLYVYERHPRDLHQCRVYTSGDPRLAGMDHAGALVLYRDHGRAHWKSDLDDVPQVWREALEV